MKPQRVRASLASLLGVLPALLCSIPAKPAIAQQTQPANAEQLFQSGKERLAQKDYAQACPMFADSFKADPATGTLLALAICHERAGKLASAFRDYTEVLARAQKETRPDREHAAREKIDALASKLSTLTVDVSLLSKLEQLEVRLNGVVIQRASLGAATPVDGGTKIIEVSARAKKPWRLELSLAESSDTKIVKVPMLEDLAPIPIAHLQEAPAPAVAPTTPATAIASAAKAQPAARVDIRSTGLSGTQITGLVMLGVGLASVTTGSYFTLRAVSKNNASKAGCDGDLCTSSARAQRLDARSAGNLATVTFIGGGSMAAAGLLMYLLGGQNKSRESRAALMPWLTPRLAGVTVRGSF